MLKQSHCKKFIVKFTVTYGQQLRGNLRNYIYSKLLHMYLQQQFIYCKIYLLYWFYCNSFYSADFFTVYSFTVLLRTVRCIHSSCVFTVILFYSSAFFTVWKHIQFIISFTRKGLELSSPRLQTALTTQPKISSTKMSADYS